jgi:hypothetical protein
VHEAPELVRGHRFAFVPVEEYKMLGDYRHHIANSF